MLSTQRYSSDLHALVRLRRMAAAPNTVNRAITERDSGGEQTALAIQIDSAGQLVQKMLLFNENQHST